MYAERKTDIDECEVEFSKMLWFNFGLGEERTAPGLLQEKKHPQEVWIRYTHEPSEKPKTNQTFTIHHYFLHNCMMAILFRLHLLKQLTTKS